MRRGVRLAVAAVLLVACGRVDYEPVAEQPFGAPVHVVELGSPGEDDDPTLTADGLEIYFRSTRASGFSDIWTSRRRSLSEPWDPPALAVELSSDAGEGSPEIAPDGLSIWFSSTRAPSMGSNDIWTSTRATRDSPWNVPTHVAELSSPMSDQLSTPSLGATFVMVVRYTEMASQDGDIWMSTRDGPSQAWSVPVLLADLNTSAHEGTPWIREDGLVVAFARGVDPLGLRDVYVARRAEVGATFSAPAPIAELNTEHQDSDPWLSPDMRRVVFASTRGGDWEIYEATR